MMRICLVGNSFAACFKRAWDAKLSESWPSVELVFYCSLGRGLSELSGSEGKLTTTNKVVRSDFAISSGRAEEVVFSDFDVCLLQGLSPRINTFRKWFVSVTSSYFSSTVRDASNPLYNSLAAQLVGEIRKVSDIPIALSPPPHLLAEDTEKTERDGRRRRLHAQLSEAITSSHEKLGVAFFEQPPETVTNLFYTSQEFGRDAIGLTRTGRQGANVVKFNDNKHMNDEFGALHLNSVLEALASASPAA